MRRNRSKKCVKIEWILLFCIALLVCSISIGHSLFHTDFQLSGEAIVRADVKTRIQSFSVSSMEKEGYESYQPMFNVKSITLNPCLPNINSKVIYTGTLKNESENPIRITSITNSVNNNENIIYLLSNIAVDDILPPNSVKEFTLTIQYQDEISTIPSNTCLALILNFDWETLEPTSLLASVTPKAGDTTSAANGAPFQVSVTNPNYVPISFNFGSNTQFSVTDANGISESYMIPASSTQTYSIYIKETPNSVFSNTTQTMTLLISTTNLKNNETISVDTLTLTLPSLPKYELVNENTPLESESNIDYSQSDSSSEGQYKTEGADGEVYFFRGNVTNNYVSFAGYTWRILQIDGNGNLKVILDGTTGSTSQWRTTNSANNLTAANALVNYTNSNVKAALNTWYNNNLKSYEERIVNTTFCIDTDYVSTTSSGTQSTVYYYTAYSEIGKDTGNYNPSLTCKEEFKYVDKIGLISAQEVVMAGGSFGNTNRNFFLYKSGISNYWWTLSPAYYDPSQKKASVFVVNGSDGRITDWPNTNLLTNRYYLRPVITLDGTYAATGSGTSSDPYVY